MVRQLGDKSVYRQVGRVVGRQVDRHARIYKDRLQKLLYIIMVYTDIYIIIDYGLYRRIRGYVLYRHNS